MGSHAARPSLRLTWPAALAFAVVGLVPLALMFLRLGEEPDAVRALIDERTLGLLGRTCLLGGGAALVSLVIGLPFGFLVARTNVLGAQALRTLGIVPILVPPIMLAMTWTMVLPVRGPVMCALILGFATFPLVSLFTARAAERVDARREESARLAGGTGAVLAMNLPLVLPAALGGTILSFIVAINDFALPDYVSAVGKKFNVYAGEVFSTWQVDGKEARAVATALPLVALTLVALIPFLALRRHDRLATIDGRFEAPGRMNLGAWRWPATLFCVAVVSVAALVPIGRLAYEAGGGPRVFSGISIRRVAWVQGGGAAANAPTAQQASEAKDQVTNAEREATVSESQKAALLSAGLQPREAPPGQVAPSAMRNRAVNLDAPEVAPMIEAREGDNVADAGGGVSVFLSNFRSSFARAFELSRESLASSLLIAFLTATLCVPLALILGHAARRSRFGGWLQLAALLPLIVPATLFGIGTIVAWVDSQTTTSLLIALGVVALQFTLAARLTGGLAGGAPLRSPRLAQAAAGLLLPSLLLALLSGIDVVRGGSTGQWLLAAAASLAALLVAAALGTGLRGLPRPTRRVALALAGVAGAAVFAAGGWWAGSRLAQTSALDGTHRFYDSLGLVTLLFVGRFVGIAVLIVSGAVASTSPRLEESARLAGAGPATRLFRIVAPGVWPSLVGTWIAVFALSVRELDAAVLVPAANDTAMFRVFNAVHFGRDDFVSALALLVIFAILLPGTLWSLFSKARLRFLP